MSYKPISTEDKVVFRDMFQKGSSLAQIAEFFGSRKESPMGVDELFGDLSRKPKKPTKKPKK